MKAALREILRDIAHIELPADGRSDGDDLYEAGLSSLTTIQLMLAIEKHFDIEIPDEMLNRYLFQSVDSLAEAVDQLKQTEQSA
ncbi:MAG: acyl carrier protein [Janthinobacterium lividum]